LLHLLPNYQSQQQIVHKCLVKNHFAGNFLLSFIQFYVSGSLTTGGGVVLVFLYNILSLSGGGRPFHPFVPSSVSSSKFLILEEEDDGRGGGGKTPVVLQDKSF